MRRPETAAALASVALSLGCASDDGGADAAREDGSDLVTNEGETGVEDRADRDDGGIGDTGCPGTPECEPGTTESRPCTCGSEVRVCQPTCTWSAWPGCAPTVCAPGSLDSEPCGACALGRRPMTCTASCTWSYGECTGAPAGVPYDPAAGLEICPPYVRPAVFLAPHPDDESIGMAGAIAEHLAAGRQVFVELLTHGEASAARAMLLDGGTCTWHPDRHDSDLTPTDFGDARVREFTEAMIRLGVTGIHVSDFGDGDVTVAEVATRIAFWTAPGDAALSLKGVEGAQDRAGASPHADHAAVHAALDASGWPDVRRYYVYYYTSGNGSPDRVDDISAVLGEKQDALAAYRVWDPASGRYAIGYHSVPALIDTASTDPREYVDLP